MTFPIDIRRTSENPRPEIQLATETAMTVRMIMILLYGAGGVPGRGEIPMIRFRKPYFEEDDFDKFTDKLKEYDIEYVHPIMEHSWGQRVVRFYDPDKHIIEVGENMKVVCKRFLDSGMTPEQVAKRMDVPMKFVNACMR